MTNPGSLNRYAYVQNDPINFIDPSGQSLKSFVGSVASKVSSTAKSVASAAKSVAKSVASTSKSTASSAYTSANSAAQAAQTAAKASATSAATAKANNAASMAYMYANEARMTGSGISGYGNYASSYTGYYNSSYETGKIPSTDAPRIKDVDEGTLKKYCASGSKKNTSSNYTLQALNSPIVEIKTSEEYTFNHVLEEFNVSEEKNGIVAAIKNFFGMKRSGTLYETNCYAFALDLTSNPLTGDDFNSDRTAKDYALQPGMLSNNTLLSEYFNAENSMGYNKMIEMMQEDVKALNKTMEPYNPATHVNADGYVIAIAAKHNDENGDNGGYHLFRLNADQEWESKDGATEAKIIDTSEASIKDIAKQMGYSDWLGLY